MSQPAFAPQIWIARLVRNKPHPDLPPELKCGIEGGGDNCRFNVTSGSNRKVDRHKIVDLSPMKLGPVDAGSWPEHRGPPAAVFENYWQYGKIFPDMPRGQGTAPHFSGSAAAATAKPELVEPTAAWRTFRDKGYAKTTKGDRHPVGTRTEEVKFVDQKGRKWRRYLTAVSSRYELAAGVRTMGYIESRRRVYVPCYQHLIRAKPAFKALVGYARTRPVLLLDYDAPLHPTRLTRAVLEQIVTENSPYGKPFGHAYVVAATLLEELTGETVRVALEPDEVHPAAGAATAEAKGKAKTGKRKADDGAGTGPMDAFVQAASAPKRPALAAVAGATKVAGGGVGPKPE